MIVLVLKNPTVLLIVELRMHLSIGEKTRHGAGSEFLIRYFLGFNFYVISLEWLYGTWTKITYKQCFLRDLFICHNIEVQYIHVHLSEKL